MECSCGSKAVHTHKKFFVKIDIYYRVPCCGKIPCCQDRKIPSASIDQRIRENEEGFTLSDLNR